MLRSDLRFDYPEELVARSPQRPPRVLLCEAGLPREVLWEDFLALIPAGDLVVINETKVMKRRIFAGDLEILFVQNLTENQWLVLFPSRKFKPGDVIDLPEGRRLVLLEKGRPQRVQIDSELTDEYFERWGEVPLPPYIQKARNERHNRSQDLSWYQTHWAKNPGSLAAPTASLHFSADDFELLKKRGVLIAPLTLHVGLGTFLPLAADDLSQHKMHFERVEISAQTWDLVQKIKTDSISGRRVWALGTTVARSLESAAKGHLGKTSGGGFSGETDLFLIPGARWDVVDCLITNFHQPESTLLALVASFSSLDCVKSVYQTAIEKKFRLFSYGDLSVWIK